MLHLKATFLIKSNKICKILLELLRVFCFLVLPENLIMGAADKVFGPATTTRHVYDVAAHHVVNGAMQGINGSCLT